MENSTDHIAATTFTPQTILLVEDELLIAMTEKSVLEKHGYKVLLAPTGEEALRIVETLSPDLILMDINLGPGMDGTEAAERMLRRRDIPLAFLSSHTEPEIVDKTEGITSYGYIVKNSGDTVLLASVRMAFKLIAARQSEAAKSQALVESEEKYRHLIENSNDVIYTLTPAGLFTFISPAWTSLLGHPVEAVLGRSFAPFIHPEDLPACQNALRDLLEGREDQVHLTYRVRHAEGSWRWHVTSALPLRDSHGEIVGIEGIARDITEEQRTRDALTKEKDLLEAIFNSVPGILYLYTAEGELVRWNRRHATMTGYSDEELRGKHLMDWYVGDETSQREVTRGLWDTVSKGFGDARAYLQKKDGTTVPMYFTACPVTIAGQEYFAGVGLDISETLRREQALAESERNLHTLFDTIDESVVLMDRQGVILAANTTFAARLGRTVEECLGCNAYTMISSDLAARRREQLEKAFRTGKPQVFEDNNQGRWMCHHLYPVKNERGEITRLVVYATDDTQAKQTQEALQESEARFHNAFLHAPVGMALISPQGAWLRANPALCDLLGYDAEELVGHQWQEMRSSEDRTPADPLATQLLCPPSGSTHGETRFLRKDGRVLWTLMSVSLVQDAQENPLYHICHIVDITSRKADVERIQALLREKDVLFREILHHVKNNMNTVKSLISLEASREPREDVRKTYQDAVLTLQSMALLFEKLYTSDTFNKLSVRSYLTPLLAQIVHVFRPDPPVRTVVQGDDVMLKSETLSSLGIILNELTTNSMKHAFEGVSDREITLSISRKDSLVTLTYEDNGTGMPPTVDFDHSPGFGMFLVKMLVQQLGGSLHLNRSAGTSVVLAFEAELPT